MPPWLSVLQGLLTPAIAVAVATIGFLQWRTAHQKVVLDLFDRRFEIYTETSKFLRHAVNNRSSMELEFLLGFHTVRNRATFLFGEDLCDHLRVIHERAIQMASSSAGLPELKRGAERKALVKSIMTDLKKLNHDFGELAQIFQPYLKMDQKRVRNPVEWFHDKNAKRLSYGNDDSST